MIVGSLGSSKEGKTILLCKVVLVLWYVPQISGKECRLGGAVIAHNT